jgi:hypothetical protein
MYWLAARDLGIYLYDNNNRPIRDINSGCMVTGSNANSWGASPDLVLRESERHWVSTVNLRNCSSLDPTNIPTSDTSLIARLRGQVLNADTVYEARLTPLLLHEDFRRYGSSTTSTTVTTINGPSGRLGNWTIYDEGAAGGPSSWQVRYEIVGVGAAVGGLLTPESQNYYYIVQTSGITGQRVENNKRIRVGTLLIYSDNSSLSSDNINQPGMWTDYRLTLVMRSSSTNNGEIGILFRYNTNQGSYYKFVIDFENKRRKLVPVINNQLRDDDLVSSIFDYQQDQDYLISIEALGNSIRIFQDEWLVFDITVDQTTSSRVDRGTIALYCSGNKDARFSDIKVDDFRGIAPVVYRFKFTTSKFVNFFHHIHSFQDETWLKSFEDPSSSSSSSGNNPIITNEQIANKIDNAVSIADTSNIVVRSPPTQIESSSYDFLALHLLQQAAFQNPSELQITKVERNSVPMVFLVQSPEPIDWRRTTIEFAIADNNSSGIVVGGSSSFILNPISELSGPIKLTNVNFADSRTDEESVDLLLRESINPTGARIEYRTFPNVPIEPLGEHDFSHPGGELIFKDTFESEESLNNYTIVNTGDEDGSSSRWEITNGELRQTSTNSVEEDPTIGMSESDPNLIKLGTAAIVGNNNDDDRTMEWITPADYRICVRLISDYPRGAIGVLFRYHDKNNYYRFSMDNISSYWRLVKVVEGTPSILWEIEAEYEIGHEYLFVIDCKVDHLECYLEGGQLFGLNDNDVGGKGGGRVGLYCWKNPGARFIAWQVSQPIWQTHYTFVKESYLPAGTRIRVYSGSSSPVDVSGSTTSNTSDTQLITRFAGSHAGEEENNARFSSGSEIKISYNSDMKQYNHIRRFISPDQFRVIGNTKIIRKADGTGFFVVVPAENPLHSLLRQGLYRMKMTFRRNNRRSDPPSQILSQDGNSNDEEVVIDIPWKASNETRD